MSSISIISSNLLKLDNTPADILVFFLYEKVEPLKEFASLVDWRFLGHISKSLLNGFITGKLLETVLIPLSNRFPGRFVLICGLGKKQSFGKERFQNAFTCVINCLHKLKCTDLIMSLPGRLDETIDEKQAIGWFLDSYEKLKNPPDVTLVEHPGAKKKMLPSIEKWRIRQLL